jgi:hypothetical protein
MSFELYIFMPFKDSIQGLDYADLLSQYKKVHIISFENYLELPDNVELITIPKKFQFVHHKQFWIRDYILSDHEGIFRAGFKNESLDFYPPLLHKIFPSKLSNYPERVDGGEIVTIDDMVITSSKEYYECNKDKINIHYISLKKESLCFFHLDIVIAPLDKERVLIADPFLLSYYQNKKFDGKEELKIEYQRIRDELKNIGFKEIISFPIVLKETKEGQIILDVKKKIKKEEVKLPFNSLLNGLRTQKYFYYTWMQVDAKEIASELKTFLKNFNHIPLKKVELSGHAHDKNGGLRCLSTEIKA